MSKINSFIPLIVETDSCKFNPNASDPIVSTDKTSPTTYPVPPVDIPAEVIDPFVTVMVAVAFFPFPVTVVKPTLVYV